MQETSAGVDHGIDDPRLTGYSVEACRDRARQFREQHLHRPMRVSRYDPGAELTYEMTPLTPGAGTEPVRAHLVIERFVGGGFAGQVYRVRLTRLESGRIPGVEPGGTYALKILIPPSRGALFFRNLLYAIGFQGSFQLQTNAVASRAGALWQKLIRRAAKIRFGDDCGASDENFLQFVEPVLLGCLSKG